MGTWHHAPQRGGLSGPQAQTLAPSEGTYLKNKWEGAERSQSPGHGSTWGGSGPTPHLRPPQMQPVMSLKGPGRLRGRLPTGHGVHLGVAPTPLLYLTRPPGRAELLLSLCWISSAWHETTAPLAEYLLCARHGAQSSTCTFPTIPHRSHSDFAREETEARKIRVTGPRSHTKQQSRDLNQVCQPSCFATLSGCSLIS